MKKLVFVGCSFTAGTGWKKSDPNSDDRNCPDLWTNLVWKNIPKFADLSLLNLGKPNASNIEIFEEAVKVIADFGSDVDTIFCQWTSMPRYNFNVGFELWDTSETLVVRHGHRRTHDVNLNRGDHWPREYINDLLDRLRVLHHLHWEILKVIKYTNIIKKLSKQSNINLFFVNGICPWDKDYFVELKNSNPEDYTEFTKTAILNINTRDDEDMHKLYSQAHYHYTQAGGINEVDWINLYDSYLKNKIDVNFDQSHPGKLSNQKYYSIVSNRLKQLNFS